MFVWGVRSTLVSPKYLLEDERALLMDTIKKYPCRDTYLIHLGLVTGARASELLSLKFIDFTGGNVYIHANKGSYDRELVLPKKLYKNIMSLQTDKNLGKPFPISYNRLYQVWNMYRPIKKTFHSLRHSFAVRAYEVCRDIYEVRDLLGHKDIQNTLIYQQFVKKKELYNRSVPKMWGPGDE